MFVKTKSPLKQTNRSQMLTLSLDEQSPFIIKVNNSVHRHASPHRNISTMHSVTERSQLAVEQPDPDPRMPRSSLADIAVFQGTCVRSQQDWAGFWSQQNRIQRSLERVFDHQIKTFAASGIAKSRPITKPVVSMRCSCVR